MQCHTAGTWTIPGSLAPGKVTYYYNNVLFSFAFLYSLTSTKIKCSKLGTLRMNP